MAGSAVIKQGRSANRKHTYFFFWPKEEQLRVTILQRMFQEGRIYRQLAEEQWIMKLKTKIPQGCNVKLN